MMETTNSQRNTALHEASDTQYRLRVLWAVGMVLLAVLVLLLLWQVGRVFLVGFAGILLGIFLTGLGTVIGQYTGLRYGWSLLIVVGVLAAVFGLVAWLIGSQVVAQVNQIADQLPNSAEQLKKELTQNSWGRWLFSHTDGLRQSSMPSGTLTGVTSAAASTFGGVFDVVLIVFIGLYLAGEPSFYRHGLILLVPQRGRRRADEVLRALEHRLRHWIYGQLLSMTIIGVLTTTGLWLLGMPLALVLGLTAATLQIIPNFGPMLSAIPAVLLAWPQGSTMALQVAGLYVGVQFLESYLITPLVQRSNVRLPPVVTLVAMLMLGSLGGVMGLLVAAPLALSLIVATKQLYVRDFLGDESVVSGHSSATA